jgi:uncharacterized OB-fold protein
VGNAVVSRRGNVYTVTIVAVETAPGFTPPFNVSTVELEEQTGLRIMSNVVGIPDEEVTIGLSVEVTFEDVIVDGQHEVSIPLFRPVANSAGSTK